MKNQQDCGGGIRISFMPADMAPLRGSAIFLSLEGGKDKTGCSYFIKIPVINLIRLVDLFLDVGSSCFSLFTFAYSCTRLFSFLSFTQRMTSSLATFFFSMTS